MSIANTHQDDHAPELPILPSAILCDGFDLRLASFSRFLEFLCDEETCTMLELVENFVASIDRFGSVTSALVDGLLLPGAFRGEARGNCVEHGLGVFVVVEMEVERKERWAPGPFIHASPSNYSFCMAEVIAVFDCDNSADPLAHASSLDAHPSASPVWALPAPGSMRSE